MSCRQQTKPLLQWMEGGDPDLVPVVMADPVSTAASYWGVAVRLAGESASFTDAQASPVTPEMVLACSRETGIHFHRSLGSATPFDLLDLMDGVEREVRQERGASGEIRDFTTLRTPAGMVSEVFLTPPDRPACWVEHLIKTEADLPVLTYLIEKATELTLEDERVRARLTAKFRAEAQRWPPHILLCAVVGVPAFALSSNQYFAAVTALYVMLDQAALMERLYEGYEQCNAVWIECAAAAGADFVLGAINGLELYSPEIYRRYFVPQARSLHETAHAHGMRGWVHTCGHMNALIHAQVYREMKVDVLESLSTPPIGDIADLGAARARLGPGLVTRGAVNVDYFYSGDLEALRGQTRKVLAATRGYRHMVGDTNDSFPPYPRENLLALVEEVRGSGRMLPV